jgi:hypothetical protein
MKKVAVIGGGSAGILTVLHYLRWTDAEIDWYQDDNEEFSVAQGTNLIVPKLLWLNAGFGYEDLDKVNGTIKPGLIKENWGKKGTQYCDDYLPSMSSYHFDEHLFHQHMTDYITRNDKVTLLNKSVTADQVDADHVMVCTGQPTDLTDYNLSSYIPTNSIYVVRCYWQAPSFHRSLHVARKHGWVFGNPLRDRCDIGYVFNDHLTNVEELQEDLDQLLFEYGLTKSNEKKVFKFNNYRRKNNFSDRVVYNGSASFFIEPMEATSLSFIGNINAYAFELWSNDQHNSEVMQNEYDKFLDRIENFIMLHYFAGSTFDSPFWELAKQNGSACMERAMKEATFMQCVYEANQFINEGKHISMTKTSMVGEYGYFWHGAFYNAIKHLGVYTDLIQKIS